MPHHRILQCRTPTRRTPRSASPSAHRAIAGHPSSRFNKARILAISHAICSHRRAADVDGPLFIGIGRHALSRPELATALEVFAANGLEIFIDEHDGYTPPPVISHAILAYNRGSQTGPADEVVLTPSHNPPSAGGFKYNKPNGAPADVDVTGGIEREVNALLKAGLGGVKRTRFSAR